MESTSQNIIFQQTSVIAVLRSGFLPEVSTMGSLVEFERSEVANANQEAVEVFLKTTLNSYIEESDPEGGCVVTSRFYVDPTGSSGYSAFSVLMLEGIDVFDNRVEYFRAVISFLCALLVGQDSLLSENDFDARILAHDYSFFRGEAQSFLKNHGGQRVKKEFYVSTGFHDREGVHVQDRYAMAETGEAIYEEEDGLAKPDGYSLSGNKIYLLVAIDGQLGTQKTTFQCSHQDHYDVVAQAQLSRSCVRFTAVRSKSPSEKNVTLSLVSLEIDATNEEGFRLT